MAKLKMKRLAYLLAACLLLLAALTGCSNTKTCNAGRTNGTTGTPTSYTGYGLDNYGGAGYGNGVSYGSGTYNGATNSSYRSNGGTRTTPNTGYLNGAGTMTGTGDLSSTDMGTNGGTSNVSADM